MVPADPTHYIPTKISIQKSQSRNLHQLGWVIDEYGHYWRVLIAIDDEAHLIQSSPEVPAVI